MRNTDERLQVIKTRRDEFNRKRNIRRYHIIILSSLMSCIVLVVGIGVAMPSIISRVLGYEYIVESTAGSIFSSGNALGYVVIGLLAFVLGVLVDIICTYLRNKNRKDKQ